MAKRPTISEADLALRVVVHLEDEGADVFQEVEFAPCGGRADIVAVRDDMVTVVETKMVLSWDLLAQAQRWVPYANRVFIAVPIGRRTAGRHVAWTVIPTLGLGALEVIPLWPIEEGRRRSVTLAAEAPFRSYCKPHLREILRPEHKTHARAGTTGGGHVTRYRLTCEAVARYVQANPGATLRQALGAVEHHYASLGGAVAMLTKWAALGRAHGLSVAEDGVVTVVAAAE